MMVRQALQRIGVYWYILPSYAMGKKIIWNGKDNEGNDFLSYIPSELIKSTNSQEMIIKLTNGSMIQVVGSDSAKNSLVGTNAIGMIFSEYALQDPTAYQYLRPILLQNQGWCIFLSCVNPDTLVIGEKGLCRIQNVSKSRSEYSDLNQKFWGLGGFHVAEQFYYGGKVPTLKITLASGYEIECTKIHQLWDGKEWVQSQYLKVGDLLPVQYGQNVWGSGLTISGFRPKEHASRIERFDYANLNNDFFYLLGLIHADGNFNNNCVCVTKKKDQQIIDFLHQQGFRTRSDGIHHELSSRTLCEFLEYLNFKHGARNKEFPEKLLECNREQMKAFIQGLFDGDGSSNSNVGKQGRIKLTSTNKSFLQTLQVILLNFGIVSSIRSEFKLPTQRVKVSSLIFNLEIAGYFAHIFYTEIGFRLERKQKNSANIPEWVKFDSGNIYPIESDRIKNYKIKKSKLSNPKRITRRLIRELINNNPNEYLSSVLAEKFFYSPIKEIVSSSSDVYDFVIPETNSFFSNGFISHNTPRGRNALFQLYEMALCNPEEWYVLKLTVDDTKHVSIEEIQKDIDSGEMSYDLAQQEYWTSFDLGVEGAYYTKYLDDMKRNGHIDVIPWDPSFKVHTNWDIGMRDSTAIIFWQIRNDNIYVIDTYDHSDVGLEHYIKILEGKPYRWGTHFAPHDMQVRELGTGMSRLERARQLGIDFQITPNLSIADGIEAVRATLPKTFIDAKKGAPLIKALENYRKIFDPRINDYREKPNHDEHSHYSDAMRYLAVSYKKVTDGMSPEDLEKRYRASLLTPRSPEPMSRSTGWF